MGVFRSKTMVFNQDDKPVMSYIAKVLMQRREPQAADPRRSCPSGSTSGSGAIARILAQAPQKCRRAENCLIANASFAPVRRSSACWSSSDNAQALLCPKGQFITEQGFSMTRIKTLSLIAGTTLLVCSPAAAQEIDTSSTFNGPYASGIIGLSAQPNDRNETLVFDTTGNGNFNDSVKTVSGANAFSPGFCGGAANGNSPAQGCRSDRDGLEYFGRIGFDKRAGSFVYGALVEGGRTELRDSVSGFSTTPASYTVTRESDYNINARLRAGYTPNGGVLFTSPAVVPMPSSTTALPPPMAPIASPIMAGPTPGATKAVAVSRRWS